MTEYKICPICSGYIGNAILYATVATTSTASVPPITFCPGHTTGADPASHFPISGETGPEQLAVHITTYCSRCGKRNDTSMWPPSANAQMGFCDCPPELVTLPQGASVYPSNYFQQQQQETLWQIAQEVAEGATLADDMMGGTDCLFCTGELGYSGSFHHTPECIVTKARTLMEWRKTQPKIEVKMVNDGEQ